MKDFQDVWSGLEQRQVNSVEDISNTISDINIKIAVCAFEYESNKGMMCRWMKTFFLILEWWKQIGESFRITQISS